MREGLEGRGLPVVCLYEDEAGRGTQGLVVRLLLDGLLVTWLLGDEGARLSIDVWMAW